jgi:hypothetical protein
MLVQWWCGEKTKGEALMIDSPSLCSDVASSWWMVGDDNTLVLVSQALGRECVPVVGYRIINSLDGFWGLLGMEGGKARSLLHYWGITGRHCLHAMPCYPSALCHGLVVSCRIAHAVLPGLSFFLCMQPAYASTAVETSEDMQCMNDTARSSLSLSTNKHKHA